MRENGLTTNNMVKELRPGLMDPTLQAILSTDCVMVPEFFNGPMGLGLMVPSLITKLMVKESIFGVMVEFTRANSKLDLWTAMVSISGQMVECTQDNMKRTKNTDTVNLDGPMGGYMTENGKMGKWKALEHTRRRMEPKGRAFGEITELCSG